METLGVNAATYELGSNINSSGVMCALLPLEVAVTAAASVSQPPAVLSSLRLRKGPLSPCLRRMSAYNGGFKDTHSWMDDSESSSMYTMMKKRRVLTFADQHGRPLIHEKLFRECEPSIQCRVDSDILLEGGSGVSSAAAIASGTAQVASSDKTRSPLNGDSGNDRLDKRWLLHKALRQQELLSMCVVSCSFLGCLLVGYRHFAVNVITSSAMFSNAAASTVATIGSSGWNAINRQDPVILATATKWQSRL